MQLSTIPDNVVRTSRWPNPGSTGHLGYDDDLLGEPPLTPMHLQVSLNEGLNKTIEYFRNELHVRRHSERNIYFPKEWLHTPDLNTALPVDHKEL